VLKFIFARKKKPNGQTHSWKMRRGEEGEGRNKEEGGRRRKEEGGRRKEEGGRRKG
jgi:hypothetical protein